MIKIPSTFTYVCSFEFEEALDQSVQAETYMYFVNKFKIANILDF